MFASITLFQPFTAIIFSNEKQRSTYKCYIERNGFMHTHLTDRSHHLKNILITIFLAFRAIIFDEKTEKNRTHKCNLDI